MFLARVTENIRHREDGHYEMPLPLKNPNTKLPNNRDMASHRLKQLKRRFASDEKYRDDYLTFMNTVIQSGYAEKVPTRNEDENNQQVWCIPHHGVYHPKKPNKIRVVFDCSAEFKGESLNKHLQQGPDMTNNLCSLQISPGSGGLHVQHRRNVPPSEGQRGFQTFVALSMVGGWGHIQPTE